MIDTVQHIANGDAIALSHVVLSYCNAQLNICIWEEEVGMLVVSSRVGQYYHIPYRLVLLKNQTNFFHDIHIPKI